MSGFVHEQVDLQEQKETINELLSAEWPGVKDHIEPDFLQSVIEADKEDAEMQLGIKEWREHQHRQKEDWKQKADKGVFIHRRAVLRGDFQA